MIPVKKIIVHENYVNEKDYRNDIAILEVNKKIYMVQFIGKYYLQILLQIICIINKYSNLIRRFFMLIHCFS